ncbi:MAG: hypothetical protein PHY73_05920 [Candidatus Omnitrophica bacterium]|nr:hypothetical protein [Candidatus Omnitrophota bacterium]
MPKKIALLVMRIPEAEFYIKMCPFFDRVGIQAEFISCHQAASKVIRKKGYICHDIFEIQAPGGFSESEVLLTEKKFGIPNIREVYFRESVQFNIKDEKFLLEKTLRYLRVMDQILNESSFDLVAQETADFIAPLTLYYASKKNNIEHLFIEPSMLKGKIVFSKNTLFADICDESLSSRIEQEQLDEATCLINEYIESKDIRMPEKDKVFFLKRGWRDLFSAQKIKSLFRKLNHKYFTKEKEEYGAIFNRCMMILERAFTLRKMKKLYTSKVPDCNYIYFPFHVPFDLQLTTRCNEFFDQIGLVEYISRKLPYGWVLVVKEHPASVGMYPFKRIRDTLKANPSICLLNPSINSFDIIKDSRAVIAVNSKAGVEAVLQGKPVIVVGKTFYRGKGITLDVDSLNKLSEAIHKVRNGWAPEYNKVLKFLAQVFLWSKDGELFGFSEDSPRKTAKSLIEQIGTV